MSISGTDHNCTCLMARTRCLQLVQCHALWSSSCSCRVKCSRHDSMGIGLPSVGPMSVNERDENMSNFLDILLHCGHVSVV